MDRVDDSAVIINDPNANSIMSGFYEDCDELIEKFLKLKSIRYSDFAKIWKEMKFHLVYSGRPTLWEMTEFGEGALAVAGKFIFSTDEKNDYHKRTAGLYLMYGLYHTCPLHVKPTARVVKSSFHILNNLCIFAKSNSHLDVLYVLCTLIRKGVFRFVATEREYNNEMLLSMNSKSTNEPGANVVLNERFQARTIDEILGSDRKIVDEISNTIDSYTRIKCQLVGSEDNIPPKELDYIDKDLIKNILESFKSVFGKDAIDESTSNQPAKRKIDIIRNDRHKKRICYKNDFDEESNTDESELSASPPQTFRSLGTLNDDVEESDSDSNSETESE